MAETYTPNFGFVLIGQGDLTDTWGTGTPSLNNTIFNPLDKILGAALQVSIAAGNTSITNANWQSANTFLLTGSLSGDATLILPINNDAAGIAVAGRFVVANGVTGASKVFVKTAAAGSTGVTVPQGFAASLYSDGTNVNYANDGLRGYALGSNGSPDMVLPGTAASANTNASLAYDYAGGALYACTTGGVAGVARWTNIVSGSLPQPALQGRLTPVSGAPVITADAVAATTVYYAPYAGSWAAIHNGSVIIPYKFTQMSLLLSASQAASNIYDVYLAYNGGTPVIGTGPSWVAGSGGSVTPGSCARGTGVGGAAVSRDAASGLWVNTASMSLIYNTGAGNNTITVPAGQGILLGSIFVDASAGQVSCYLTYQGGTTAGPGMASKWGISNAYNRVPVIQQVGDSSTTHGSTGNFNIVQNQSGPGWAQLNGTGANLPAVNGKNPTSNLIQTFCCLPEEEIEALYSQVMSPGSSTVAASGIGINSTTAPSGASGVLINLAGAIPFTSHAILAPSIGVNRFYPLVYSGGGTGNNITIYTQNGCLLTARYRA